MADTKINRTWAMANKNTFSVKPVGQFVKKYLRKSKVSVDPFARDKGWATWTNDLNPKTGARFHMDSIDFLQMLTNQGVVADLVLFDPPYSPRQIKECYDGIGKKMEQLDAMRTNWMRERDLIHEILAPKGIVLSFGWNSMGMGNGRGYDILEILMVCHGVGHNDTICMAEQKVQHQVRMF